MVRPSLAEVMEHDGPICARGPSGRGPVSLVRIRLCFILAAFRDKRAGWGGALCRCMCNHSSRLHCEGGSPTGHLIHCLALHVGNRDPGRGRGQVAGYWWQRML